MAVNKLLDAATTNGIGTSVVNGNTLALFGITLHGVLDGAFVDILVDLAGGEDWVVAGSLSQSNAAQLLMLPPSARCNARLVGASTSTNVTVSISS